MTSILKSCESCGGSAYLSYADGSGGECHCSSGLALAQPEVAGLIVKLWQSVRDPKAVMSALGEDERAILADACVFAS